MTLFQVAFQYQEIFYFLDQIGLRDLILPFVLIFTILFAVLSRIKIFGGEKSKRFDTLVALVITLVVVIPHVLGQYPPGSDVVQIINDSLPGVAAVLVALVAVFILVGLFAQEKLATKPTGMIIFLALVAVGYIFGNSAGWWERMTWIPNFLYDARVQALIVIIAVFWIVIASITSEPGSTSGFRRTFEEIGESLGSAFGRK